MIIDRELAAWCRDRAAQRHARRQADDFAEDWNAGAAQAMFAAATAGLESPSAEAVAVAISNLFADPWWLDALVEGLAAELRADRFFEPPFRHLNSDVHSGLVVFEDDRVSVAAGVTSAAALAQKKNGATGGRSVAFSGQVEVFRFLKAGGATLSLWEAPRIGADFTAGAAGRCRRTGERALADGDVLIVDGRSQSFVIERAESNLVVVQATVKPDRAPVSVEYDRQTGDYLGCSAADDSASRIQMLTTLLRKLDCAAAFPAIADFLGHPNFFVRWHVMRELFGLDAEAALPELRRMAAGDPHPENRRAARRVLEQIEHPPSDQPEAA